MFFLEMQAELARTWMRIAEDGARAVSEACLANTQQATRAIQDIVETSTPKPAAQIPLPFATTAWANPFLPASFPPANPFLAANPFVSGNPMLGALLGPMLGSLAPMLTAGWPFSTGMMGTANPWSSLMAANPFMPNIFSANALVPAVFAPPNPWANLWAPAWPATAAFATPANLWGNNPWTAMMQTLQPSPPTLADYVVSSFRTASGHATAAVLAPMQTQSQPEATQSWFWPLGSNGQLH